MMKLSDYVFQFLQEKGVQHAFMLPGGGAMHLDDSIGRSGIQYICTLHEQRQKHMHSIRIESESA